MQKTIGSNNGGKTLKLFGIWDNHLNGWRNHTGSVGEAVLAYVDRDVAADRVLDSFGPDCEVKDLATVPDDDTIVDVWTLDDVLTTCCGLTAQEGREVLESLKRKFDASIGINWDVISATAAYMYPGRDHTPKDEG